MTPVIPDILAKIIEQKRKTLARSYARVAVLEQQATDRKPARDFRAALMANPPAIIGEIKKASPSKGQFVKDFQPVEIAKQYAAGGAAALSVLTDEDFFRGSLEDMKAARAAVNIPVLRKDFTIDEFYVIEAAAHGADAILLIAAILETNQLREYRELAREFSMDALVEVHDDQDLSRALDSGAEIIGVNNRNLRTFEVKLETSLKLAEKIPDHVVRVAESGISSSADVQKLAAAGYSAFLVGEHLMLSANPARAIEALRR